MSVEMESDSGTEIRSVLGPGGNRIRVSESEKTKKTQVKTVKKSPPLKKPVNRSLEPVKSDSVNSCSSDCTSTSTASASSVKIKRVKSLKKKSVPETKEIQIASQSPLSPEKMKSAVVKRCDWITPNSDPLYAAFHDEEWGVPVHDDNKLFESLVLSIALAELSWPSILNQRGLFRKQFDDFDIASVAKITEKKLLTLKAHGNFLLSEPKLRAVVENAKQMLKVQQEFGSFNNYCWNFVNQKPIKNSHRYARHVPAKTAKADFISKDLIRRGFRCVGPTVVYSFMQTAGLVNDHLVTCFRHQECDSNVKTETECEKLAEDMEKICVVTM